MNLKKPSQKKYIKLSKTIQQLPLNLKFQVLSY